MKTETETLSAAGWVARLGDTQELSAAEKEALTDFLRESPTHVRELMEHTFIRADLKALLLSPQQLDQWTAEARASVAGAMVFPTGRFPERRALDPRLDSVEPQDGSDIPGALPTNGSHWRNFRGYLIAASVVGVLAIGGVFVHSQMGLYTTGFGEQRTLTLADGSVVTLNTESRIRVDLSARSRSVALLQGEAFFRVAHDTHRPFLVSAADTVVHAVGTRFNIRMATEDTVVSVLDGVVKVTDSEGARVPASEVTLREGEEARIARHPGAYGGKTTPPIKKLDTAAVLHAASWTQGRLEFEDAPLKDVLAEFQRYRHFDVDIDDDTSRELEITGSFESHDPESVLAYIATIQGIVVEKTGPRSYHIHRR